MVPDSLTAERLQRLVGLALLVGGAVLAGYGGYDYLQQSGAVEDAVEVNATVTEVHVEEVTRNRGRTGYRPRVTFEYRFRGSSHTAGNLHPSESARIYESASAARSEIRDYEAGESVTAYVPPDSPGEAFLEAERSTYPLEFVGFGAVVALMGAVWLFRTLDWP